MVKYRVINKSTQIIVANARMANTFLTRLKGLLGSSSLAAGEGLLIQPCNSVHTFGMRYPIDVVFLNKDLEVQKIVPNMPARQMALCNSSALVLELPAGMAERTGTQVGNALEMIKL